MSARTMVGKRRLTHGDQLVAMLLIGLTVCAALVAFAVHQPWLGLRFALDDREQIIVDTSVGPSAHVPEDIALNAISRHLRSEEHTSELQSLMRNSYAVFC